MIKRLFCFFLIFFFLISNSFAKENFILNWDKLIPLNAYDFVPETGITFEMWDDKNFVKKLNEAGLKFNKKIIGKSIKLYGFMVPLEMDYHEDLIVNEFILVPSAGMCIHVPPPPPNQMVMIKLDKLQKARFMYQPIYVEGILKNTPPIKDTFDSIYEIYTNKIINIDNDEFIKHFEESQK